MQKQQPTLSGFPCGGALVFRRCPLSPTSFRITRTSLCHGPEGPEPSAAPTSPPCLLLAVRSLTRLTPAVPDPLGVCFRHMSQSLQGLCIHGPSGWHVPRSTLPMPRTPEPQVSFLHIIWGLSISQEASSFTLQPFIPLYFLSQHPLPPALTSRIFAQCPSLPSRTQALQGFLLCAP